MCDASEEIFTHRKENRRGERDETRWGESNVLCVYLIGVLLTKWVGFLSPAAERNKEDLLSHRWDKKSKWLQHQVDLINYRSIVYVNVNWGGIHFHLCAVHLVESIYSCPWFIGLMRSFVTVIIQRKRERERGGSEFLSSSIKKMKRYCTQNEKWKMNEFKKTVHQSLCLVMRYLISFHCTQQIVICFVTWQAGDKGSRRYEEVIKWKKSRHRQQTVRQEKGYLFRACLEREMKWMSRRERERVSSLFRFLSQLKSHHQLDHIVLRQSVFSVGQNMCPQSVFTLHQPSLDESFIRLHRDATVSFSLSLSLSLSPSFSCDFLLLPPLLTQDVSKHQPLHPIPMVVLLMIEQNLLTKLAREYETSRTQRERKRLSTYVILSFLLQTGEMYFTGLFLSSKRDEISC